MTVTITAARRRPAGGSRQRWRNAGCVDIKLFYNRAAADCAHPGRFMKLNIAERIGMLAVFMVVITAIVVGGMFYQRSKDLLIESALQDFSNEIALAGQQIQEQIQVLRENTRLLSRVPPIQGLLRSDRNSGIDLEGNSTAAQWEQRLKTIFSVMLTTQPDYLMARFLDADGRERVRVDRVGDEIVIAARTDLQDKALRPYVIETLKLSPGRLYLSDIDLNQEFGKIVEPRQEVLRSAIAVYDAADGTIAGLVVINLDAGAKLRQLQRNLVDAGREVFVTNDRGDYLLHPDATRTYGFDRGQRFRIQQDYPALTVLFDAVDPVSEVMLLPEDSGSQQAGVYARFAIDRDRPERFIAIGITQPYAQIVAGVRGALNGMVGGAALLVLLAVALSLLLSRRLSRPLKQVTHAVREYARGRSAAGLPVDRGDEIGLLARSFQSMARQVDEARTRLSDMNRGLEATVQERTRELQRSELRQRIVVENMVEGLISIDEQGLIQGFNPAAERLFGYAAAEVAGRNVSMLMPEPDASAHDGYMRAYHETGTPRIIGRTREVEGRRRDGSTFPMDLAVNEMWFDDQRLYIGSVRDITERKQVERLKNEFISTVSHELRTPLTSIRGSLGLLLGGAVGELPAKVVELLTIAGNNTERLLLLINDILDIQKIESGKMAFRFETVPLMPFLQQAVAEHASYGAQYGTSFVITRALEDAAVYVDRDRLMQVMGNLLSNAAKFSPPGGRVEISVARQHDGRLRVSVSDYGPGIPEDFRDKLFTRFSQSDSSDTRQKGGTGLGLAITKALVERLGGRIGVTTSTGLGSTFYFELPAMVSNDAVVEGGMRRSLPDQRASSVLIVEDDTDIGVLIQRMLSAVGYDADIAADAEQARQMLAREDSAYRLLVLDIMLPGEDGISLLRSLRADPSTRELPVVVVSAIADETRRELEGGALGVVDWLTKPIDQQRLVRAVKQAAPAGERARVLHVEDEPDVYQVVNSILRDHCELTWADTLAAGRRMLQTRHFDLLLLDIGLPDGSGLDLIETIERCDIPPQVVIFSAMDVSEDYAGKVSAVLVKSRTSNQDLLRAITRMLPQA